MPDLSESDAAELEQLRAERLRLQAQLDEKLAADAVDEQAVEVNITPTQNRKPLVVNYGTDAEGNARRFVLPGRVPSEVLTAIDSVPRPRGNVGVLKREYQEATGLAATASFLETVVPDDFRAVLDLEDVPAVYQAWANHTGLGKA